MWDSFKGVWYSLWYPLLQNDSDESDEEIEDTEYDTLYIDIHD